MQKSLQIQYQQRVHYKVTCFFHFYITKYFSNQNHTGIRNEIELIPDDILVTEDIVGLQQNELNTLENLYFI